MTKKRKRFYIKWLLAIAWMVVIFKFSNDPATVSDAKSGTVITMFDSIGLNLNSLLGTLANFIVRKVAHFTEFLILYVFLYNALSESYTNKKALVIAIVFTFLYACSDEFHQTFIPGREGRFRDVLIDTSGGIAAFMYFYFSHPKKNSYK
ncbi:VanZ family protein [Clostridium brassicae]|uniref:VanZ family protein n=1 Tax=Clostridium brassicae TaxID=2999072 RepID=A0ABT4D5Q7_9CLOT|nr:VanZ family protein [Clostridium brassicae]MCY6957018.1 VanZ family protein [Clostridium brassicae]